MAKETTKKKKKGNKNKFHYKKWQLLLTYSWLACRSLARGFSPPSNDRPTDTMKFSPIFDFMEMGGLVSSAEKKEKMSFLYKKKHFFKRKKPQDK